MGHTDSAAVHSMCPSVEESFHPRTGQHSWLSFLSAYSLVVGAGVLTALTFLDPRWFAAVWLAPILFVAACLVTLVIVISFGELRVRQIESRAIAKLRSLTDAAAESGAPA